MSGRARELWGLLDHLPLLEPPRLIYLGLVGHQGIYYLGIVFPLRNFFELAEQLTETGKVVSSRLRPFKRFFVRLAAAGVILRVILGGGGGGGGGGPCERRLPVGHSGWRRPLIRITNVMS